jgi:hypothetical protein
MRPMTQNDYIRLLNFKLEDDKSRLRYVKAMQEINEEHIKAILKKLEYGDSLTNEEKQECWRLFQERL